MSLHYLVKKKQVAAERLLRTRTTFSQPVVVSVGVSKLGVTDLIFVDPGAKVNGAPTTMTCSCHSSCCQ